MGQAQVRLFVMGVKHVWCHVVFFDEIIVTVMINFMPLMPNYFSE